MSGRNVSSGNVVTYPGPQAIPQGGDLPSKLRNTFLEDLATARNLQEGEGSVPQGVSMVSYIDPLSAAIGTNVAKPEVAFPNLEGIYGPRFAFLVRPAGSNGESSHDFYGAPIWTGEVEPLVGNRILERRIGALRLQENIRPDEDKLVGIIREMHGGRELKRFAQDLLVGITVGDLIRAYETEANGGLSTTGAMVRKVTIAAPTNPLYKTEAIGFVANNGRSPAHSICFAYVVGETVYRGRPILDWGSSGPRLTEIDRYGKEAYFEMDALARARDTRDGFNAGNFLIIALPLVGRTEQQPTYPPTHYLGSGGDFRGGPTTLSYGDLGVSKGGRGSLDLAAFSTGRQTGQAIRFVNSGFDPTRTISVIDATVLAFTPSRA